MNLVELRWKVSGPASLPYECHVCTPAGMISRTADVRIMVIKYYETYPLSLRVNIR